MSKLHAIWQKNTEKTRLFVVGGAFALWLFVTLSHKIIHKIGEQPSLKFSAQNLHSLHDELPGNLGIG